MRTGIVVAHAGVGTDLRCHVFQGGIGQVKGHQRALIAQAARIKDGADLPDDVCLFQTAHPRQHLGFLQAKGLAQRGKGARRQGKVCLQPFQQRPINGVQWSHDLASARARGW